MNTTRTKTTLNNFEPTARAKNHIAGRDSNIVEDELAMPVRSIIVTVD